DCAACTSPATICDTAVALLSIHWGVTLRPNSSSAPPLEVWMMPAAMGARKVRALISVTSGACGSAPSGSTGAEREVDPPHELRASIAVTETAASLKPARPDRRVKNGAILEHPRR